MHTQLPQKVKYLNILHFKIRLLYDRLKSDLNCEFYTMKNENST